jgi:hypothetical protein
MRRGWGGGCLRPAVVMADLLSGGGVGEEVVGEGGGGMRLVLVVPRAPPGAFCRSVPLPRVRRGPNEFVGDLSGAPGG